MALKRKSRHAKVELVFDPQERHSFLTGFSKRKQARKKAAREEIDKKFKEEVTRIKKEKRERIKKQLEEMASVRRANGIELTQLAQNELAKEKVLDLPRHVITITCTEELDLSKAASGAYLGSNVEAVEVIDVDDQDQVSQNLDDKIVKDEQNSNGQSNAARSKSTALLATLAKKSQVLNSKTKHCRKSACNGKMSKAQKKFLKKKHKHKPSR